MIMSNKYLASTIFPKVLTAGSFSNYVLTNFLGLYFNTFGMDIFCYDPVTIAHHLREIVTVNLAFLHIPITPMKNVFF